MTVQGAKNDFLNGEYTKSTNVNGNAVYFDSDREYGIWFDGDISDPKWMFGRKIEFDEGKFKIGYSWAVGDTSCPHELPEWREYYDGEWGFNEDLILRKCSYLSF